MNQNCKLINLTFVAMNLLNLIVEANVDAGSTSCVLSSRTMTIPSNLKLDEI